MVNAYVTSLRHPISTYNAEHLNTMYPIIYKAVQKAQLYHTYICGYVCIYINIIIIIYTMLYL